MTALICIIIYFTTGEKSLAQTTQERLGYSSNARLLVIHADDFGETHAANRAISEALEKGWVTSASVMVPCPWFPEVVRFAKEHPDMDLGVHLTLTSEWEDLRWGPVAPKDKVPSLLDADGYLPLTAAAVTRNAAPGNVEIELRTQIERAQKMGVSMRPTLTRTWAPCSANWAWSVKYINALIGAWLARPSRRNCWFVAPGKPVPATVPSLPATPARNYSVARTLGGRRGRPARIVLDRPKNAAALGRRRSRSLDVTI